MSTDNGISDDVVGSVTRALDKIRAEREAFEAQYEEQRRQYHAREEAIKEAVRQALRAAFGDEIPSAGPVIEDHEGAKLSISQKHLAAIEEYLAERGSARQADVVERLTLNSGTVSVGLRRLEQAGLIKKGDKKRGSRVWEHTAPTDAEKRREVVLTAGQGVHEGRLVKG